MPFEVTSFFTYFICGKMGMMPNQSRPSKQKKIEDYEPGVSQAQVHKALKKVAKAKPSPKHA
jgi:hypothetical protein